LLFSVFGVQAVQAGSAALATPPLETAATRAARIDVAVSALIRAS
jgi:hypothetical protein